MPPSSTVRVWDIPLRLFHALFAISLLFTLAIAFLAGEDSVLFPYHKLLGLSAGYLLLARVLMGWVGGRHARWNGLLRRPKEVLAHLRALPRRDDPEAGHNPLASWVYLAMFTLVAGLVVTGLTMSASEAAEELHEVLAFGLIGLLMAHAAGLVLHTLRFHEPVALSMLTGSKRGRDDEAAGPAPASGLLMAVFLILLVRMWSGYSPRTGSLHLPLIPGTLSLAEDEDGEHEHGERHDHDGDDED